MKINKAIVTLLLMTALLTACSAGRITNKSCGCAAKRGMVGY
jgi:hypothetical protein